MATKTPYYNEELPTLRFPWALKVSNFSELLLVSGHADVNSVFPLEVCISLAPL